MSKYGAPQTPGWEKPTSEEGYKEVATRWLENRVTGEGWVRDEQELRDLRGWSKNIKEWDTEHVHDDKEKTREEKFPGWTEADFEKLAAAVETNLGVRYDEDEDEWERLEGSDAN